MIDSTSTNGPRMPGPPPIETVEETITATAETTGQATVDGDSTGRETETRYEPSLREICGGIASLTAWTLVFTIGMIFPSDPIRTALNGTGATISNWMVLPYVLMFLMTYTVSNVAILCCISAWLGELGRRTRIDGAAQGGPFLRGDYIAAVMRGFLAYLAILTGFVVIGSGVNVFVTPSAEGFVRLAAVVSLAGFLIGFNPALLRGIESKVTGSITSEKSQDGSETTTISGPAKLTKTVKTETATTASARANSVAAGTNSAGKETPASPDRIILTAP